MVRFPLEQYDLTAKWHSCLLLCTALFSANSVHSLSGWIRRRQNLMAVRRSFSQSKPSLIMQLHVSIKTKSLRLESWRKSKVSGLMRSRGGGRKFEVILPQPLTDVKVCLSFLCAIFALIGSESCSSCWSSSQILFLLCISMHTLCTTYQCLFVRESTHVYYVCLCACMYACLCVSLYAVSMCVHMMCAHACMWMFMLLCMYPWCVYMHVHVHVCVYLHLCAYMCMYVYELLCMCICVQVCVLRRHMCSCECFCPCVHSHTCVCMYYVCENGVHVCMWVFMLVCIYMVCIHVLCMHECMHVCMCVCMYAYVYLCGCMYVFVYVCPCMWIHACECVYMMCMYVCESECMCVWV